MQETENKGPSPFLPTNGWSACECSLTLTLRLSAIKHCRVVVNAAKPGGHAHSTEMCLIECFRTSMRNLTIGISSNSISEKAVRRAHKHHVQNYLLLAWQLRTALVLLHCLFHQL